LAQPVTRQSVDLSQPISSALILVLLPFFSRPLRALVTFVTLAPTLFKGVNALLTPGSKVAALDATAVGLAALRGDYFTANATHFLLKVGEYLEYTTERQSEQLLKQLLHPAPTRAWVERDGSLSQISCQDLREGDHVVVGVGELIPIDGRIVQGTALVNQASLTGESLPISKSQASMSCPGRSSRTAGSRSGQSA
jgi:cation transport ATPase